MKESSGFGGGKETQKQVDTVGKHVLAFYESYKFREATNFNLGEIQICIIRS